MAKEGDTQSSPVGLGFLRQLSVPAEGRSNQRRAGEVKDPVVVVASSLASTKVMDSVHKCLTLSRRGARKAKGRCLN